jgi:hypothetical protein
MHLRRGILFIVIAVLCSQCTLIHSVFDKGHTAEIAKPRLHKSWYKKSRWHKRIHIGRYQIRVFEKSGVKKVKVRS